MRAQFSKAFIAVSVVVAALSGIACRKSSEEQLREAKNATAEAEQKASQTTITNAEIASAEAEAKDETQDEARIAKERALREHAEAITAARNEQLAYRGKLQAALDELDTKRRDAMKRGHGHGDVHLKAVDAKREALKHHLDGIDRTTDSEWGSLKAKIDRDLKDLHGEHGSGEGK